MTERGLSRLGLAVAAGSIFAEVSAAAWLLGKSDLLSRFVPARGGGGNWIGGLAVASALSVALPVAAGAGLVTTMVVAAARPPVGEAASWRRAFVVAALIALGLYSLVVAFVAPAFLLGIAVPVAFALLLAWRPVAPRIALAILPSAWAAHGAVAYVQAARSETSEQSALTFADVVRSGSDARLSDILASSGYVSLQDAHPTTVERAVVDALTVVCPTSAEVEARVGRVVSHPSTRMTPSLAWLRAIQDDKVGALPGALAESDAQSSGAALILYAAERKRDAIVRDLSKRLSSETWGAALAHALRCRGDALWLVRASGRAGPDGRLENRYLDAGLMRAVAGTYPEPARLAAVLDLDSTLAAYFAFYGDDGFGAVLLGAGADVNRASECGATPLGAYLSHSPLSPGALSWLLDHGADPNRMTKGFCGVGAEPREADGPPAPPLWVLLARAQRKPPLTGDAVIQSLIAHGADTAVRDASGRTLAQAAGSSQRAFAEALSRRPAAGDAAPGPQDGSGR